MPIVTGNYGDWVKAVQGGGSNPACFMGGLNCGPPAAAPGPEPVPTAIAAPASSAAPARSLPAARIPPASTSARPGPSGRSTRSAGAGLRRQAPAGTMPGSAGWSSPVGYSGRAPAPTPARRLVTRPAIPRSALALFGRRGLGAASLSPVQIYQVAVSAGFPADTAVKMVAIALKESGGNPTAHNPIPPDDSYGLWQINLYGKLRAPRMAQFALSAPEDLYDPATNARAALLIWGWNDANLNVGWAINDGGINQARYQANLPTAIAAAAAVTGSAPADLVGSSADLVSPGDLVGSSPDLVGSSDLVGISPTSTSTFAGLDTPTAIALGVLAGLVIWAV